jgi:hypothetical protein
MFLTQSLKHYTHIPAVSRMQATGSATTQSLIPQEQAPQKLGNLCEEPCHAHPLSSDAIPMTLFFSRELHQNEKSYVKIMTHAQLEEHLRSTRCHPDNILMGDGFQDGTSPALGEHFGVSHFDDFAHDHLLSFWEKLPSRTDLDKDFLVPRDPRKNPKTYDNLFLFQLLAGIGHQHIQVSTARNGRISFEVRFKSVQAAEAEKKEVEAGQADVELSEANDDDEEEDGGSNKKSIINKNWKRDISRYIVKTWFQMQVTNVSPDHI